MAKTNTIEALTLNGRSFDGAAGRERAESRSLTGSAGTTPATGTNASPDDQMLDDIVAMVSGYGLAERLRYLLGEHHREATAALRRFRDNRA